MIEYYRLYLPKSKREVRIQISLPRIKDNIIFDTLYLLDGQNAFKDNTSAYGRSIRANKQLNFAAKHLRKRIIGIAIYNSGSDMGRVNEYSPWKMEKPLINEWSNNNPKICMNFYDDFISTIIPFIEKKYNVSQDRYIYGSSLGAVMAAYMCLNDDTFKACGLFSLASFLFESEFDKFLDLKMPTSKNKRIFLYVGKNESSDSMENHEIYYYNSIRIHNKLKENGIKTRLVISQSGEHNEETWGYNFLDFINFIYFDDMIYKY